MSSGPNPSRAQLIYTDVPGALPASYTIPPGLDLDLASSFAKVDGASASGSFLVCLTLLSQDGKVIARVPQDTTYATGDTGDCTWSPFLRTAASSTPPPPSGGTTAVAALSAFSTAVGASRTVAWDTFSTSDTSIFATAATNGGADSNTAGNQYVKGKATGVYLFVVAIKPDTPTNGQQVDVTSWHSTPMTDHQGYPGDIVQTALTDDALEVDSFALDIAGGNGFWTVELSNGGGSDIQVNCAVHYLGTAALGSVF